MGGGTRGPVAPATAFWDASAVVPLCVREPRSAQALSLHKRYEIVVWWGTQVEIASALARLLRMKLLSHAEWAQAQKTARALAQGWTVVRPSDIVRAKALQMVEKYDLRAADAFQLAAALEWCSDAPRGRAFLTADQRVFQAAMLCGFDATSL